MIQKKCFIYVVVIIVTVDVMIKIIRIHKFLNKCKFKNLKKSRHLDSNQGPMEYYNHYNPSLYQLSYSEFFKGKPLTTHIRTSPFFWVCPSRESNPRLLLGRQQCYHYTTRAKKPNIIKLCVGFGIGTIPILLPAGLEPAASA